MASYEEKLQQEAELWGSVDEANAATVPPDWRAHRHLRHNVISHTRDIDALLAQIQPGMKTLELGCASGWLTLAMAQRGADATGLDISEKSLQIARDYYEKVATETEGTTTYQRADLNRIELAPNSYDVIVTKGTLHHLVEMEHVIEQIYQALKPGGLFWINDSVGNSTLLTSLFAGGLMFILPTTVSYREKLGGLLKFGMRAPQRIRASMEAEGLSPFEGAGREHDWLKLVQERFIIEHQTRKPAVTGYLAHQISLPDAIALPLLRVIKVIDVALVKLRVLHSTSLVVYARKPV